MKKQGAIRTVDGTIGPMKPFLLAILLSCTAHAAPAPDHVGDFVKYHVTGEGTDYFKKSTVVKFDPRRRAYLVETAVTADDQDPEVTQAWMAATEIYTPEKGRQDLVNCEKFPGRAETFLLNGVIYPVCRHYFENTTAYELVGAFPINGIARTVEDGNAAKEELIDFAWAKH